MPLLASILRGTFYLRSNLAADTADVVASSAYLPSDAVLNSEIFTQANYTIIDLKKSNMNDANLLNAVDIELPTFFSDVYDKISHAIKVLQSVEGFTQVENDACESGLDIAMLKWFKGLSDPTEMFDLKVFRDLKTRFHKDLLPMYSDIKRILSSKNFMSMFESYVLLNQEWQVLDDFFAEHDDILANDAYRFSLQVLIDSYKRSQEALIYFKTESELFKENSADFNIFMDKVSFLLESNKKVGLQILKQALESKDFTDLVPKGNILPVYFNIDGNYFNVELEKELVSQVQKIKSMDESSFVSDFVNIVTLDDKLYLLLLTYKAFEYLNGIKISDGSNELKEFFYASPNYNLLSIRRVNADPSNPYSNEIVFRDFDSDFSKKTIMIFYDIDPKTSEKYYWVVSEAFTKPLNPDNLFRADPSNFFSEISNFKNYITYSMSALEHLHSKQISGVVPRIGNIYSYLGPTPDYVPFDLKYAKSGFYGLKERISNDYSLFLIGMKDLALKVDDKYHEEVECFMKSIMERASNNVDGKTNSSLIKFELPSFSSIICAYHSLKAKFLKLVRYY